MASLSLVFDILAKERASKEFDKVGDAADRAGKKGTAFGKVVGGAMVAGVGALTAVLKTGFGEVKDFQAGFADLQNVLKTTHGAAGLTADQMENLASSIQNYSGQTDDSIVKAEGLLATFTNIRNSAGKNNDIFSQATKLTADMAQKFGGDASGAAVQLGKALNDPVKGITALSRIGVSFTAGQKKTIASLVKSGDTMGAQKIILAELNKEVGGSAAAYGKTLPGQVDRAKRSFEDISQQLVTKMLPTLTSLASFISKNLKVIGPLVAILGTAAVTFILVDKAVKAGMAVKAAWLVLTGAQTEAQVGLNVAMTANPIGLVIAAVAALVVGIVIAYKKVGWFRDAVNALWGALKTAFGWVKSHWPLLLGILTGPFGLAVVLIVKYRDKIWHAITALPGLLKKGLVAVKDALISPFREAFNAIAILWNNTIGKISFHVPGWVPKIGGKGFDVPDIPTFGGSSSPSTVTGITSTAPSAHRDPDMARLVINGGLNITTPEAAPTATVRTLQNLAFTSGL